MRDIESLDFPAPPLLRKALLNYRFESGLQHQLEVAKYALSDGLGLPSKIPQCTLSSNQRSQSIAAWQPKPAAVIACLYLVSTTSPAAKTPETLVIVCSL